VYGGGIGSGPNGARHGDSGTAARFFSQFSHDTDLADLPTFIYQAKASRSERERGCEGIGLRGKSNVLGDGMNSATKVRTKEQEVSGVDRGSIHNHHPTVKPLALLRHLCRLVTPTGGTVLDPFAGSGTTGCAAMLEGLRFLGAEREPEYIAIARARIGYYATQSGRVVSDGVAPQKKSIVAPQKNATKLRSLSTLPKRVI
jgi:site-specific DNA-methyltransferase (adenine-specific)